MEKLKKKPRFQETTLHSFIEMTGKALQALTLVTFVTLDRAQWIKVHSQ
jgi:hypothetical protein